MRKIRKEYSAKENLVEEGTDDSSTMNENMNNSGITLEDVKPLTPRVDAVENIISKIISDLRICEEQQN